MSLLANRINDVVYEIRVKKKQFYEFFYFRWLKRKLKPSKRILDHCNACGYCCYYSVCVPTPDELDIIAKYLHLDPVDFILKRCAFAHFHKETEIGVLCIIYPRFLTKSIRNKAGTQLYSLDFFDTKGCIFLNESNECLIYPVRPQEAKLMTCWQEHSHNEPILTWNNDILTSKYGITIERE